MANVPHKALLASCEAINGIHRHYGDDAEDGDDAEENTDKNKTEHFCSPFWF